MAKKPSVAREDKPVCERCKHPISFHGKEGRTSCHAHGCTCNSYKGLTNLAVLTLSVEDVALQLGRGQTWVKDNAKALGGKKVAASKLFRGMGRSGTVWRFDPEKVAAHLEQ